MPSHSRAPALPYEMWGVYEIDLWLRYKSKAVDLVWFNRTCKVSLRAGRGRVSGRGGGISFPIRIAARLSPIVLPSMQVWPQEIQEGNREHGQQ
jgi:hypothetical protein